MPGQKVIAISLDAFDMPLSDALIARGAMSDFADLKRVSARFELEHGPQNSARDTGLTGEHVSTGQTPETIARWSPYEFDPATYGYVQRYSRAKPYLGKLNKRFLVFDAPHFNLEDAPNGSGIVGWSGHDPGTLRSCRPDSLSEELDARFGSVGDQSILNQAVYSSPEATEALAEHILQSARRRNAAAEWLLTERFDDWDVALVGYGESHDAIEQFLHGVDARSPASALPSAAFARKAVETVYEEISIGVGRLKRAFPDAVFLVFAMHSMGPNETDVPAMLLLPELMLRLELGRSLFRPRESWREAETPFLNEGEEWSETLTSQLRRSLGDRVRDIPETAKRGLDRVRTKLSGGASEEEYAKADDESVPHWMPGYHYRRYWSQMRAFALPNLFDGWIRMNLKGRERDGVVAPEDYDAVLDEIETMLNEVVDENTGEPAIRRINRPGRGDPYAVTGSQGDLHVDWRGNVLGFIHPKWGRIGPAPVRRVGGHSGGHGRLYISGAKIKPGEYGLRSSFDVAPTIVDLLGAPRPNDLDGESVLASLRM